MKVLKFGGTSVGSAASIKNVKDIIDSQKGRKLVVVSAMAGVTNQLVELHYLLSSDQIEASEELVEQIKQKHLNLIDELFDSSEEHRTTTKLFRVLFSQLEEVVELEKEEAQEAVILTFGETFLSFIFSRFLENEGISNSLLDAKEFMHISSVENPEIETVQQLLQQTLKQEVTTEVFVTQGFVRIDRNKDINT